MMSRSDMRDMCCWYLSALSAPAHSAVVKKRWGQCTDEQTLWKTVTSAERVDAAFKAKRWAGQTRLSLRSESERKNSRRVSVPFTLRLLQKRSDSLSGCVRQRWNDAKQSKQLRWSPCLCARDCGNACKDSHVVDRLCLSRSYLSVHTASAHISSFTSPGPAYKPETWVWNGTKPLDFHFHLINDRMYTSGHHVLCTQRSENKSHLECAAASRVLYRLDFINSLL